MKILVMGGGVIGLSCAWRLAAAGAQVELFDARVCGQGATLAALGALWPASPLVRGPLQQLHRESLWQFAAFVHDLVAQSGQSVTLRRLGRLELLNSKKAEARAREEAAYANAHWPAFAPPAPTMQILGPEEISAHQPGLAPPPFAALLCRATAQVQVPELITALRAVCHRCGVKIHEHTSAVALDRSDDHMTALRTTPAATASPVSTHTADAFLMAAGAWTSLLDRNSRLDLEHVAPVRPVKRPGTSAGYAARRPPHLYPQVRLDLSHSLA